MQRKECESNLQFPITVSGTGISETQTLSIKPCDLECGCYVKGNKFWCNHCCDLYQILEQMVENNQNLSIGALMSLAMKQLRGKYSGELVNKFLNLLTKEGERK